MPVTPNFIERTILLKLNKGPGPMLDLLGAMSFKAVVIALRLNIFETLGSGALSATEVATKTGADERGMVLLLQALEAVGYVKKSGDTYANTPMTTKWMLRRSPQYVGDFFPYFEGALERWNYLEEAIRRGKTPMLAWEWLDKHPGNWESYNRAMAADARMNAVEILSKTKLPPTARRLIDIGGGHGLYAINFCKRYPSLSATILDWPQTKDIAEANIRTEGMEKRVNFREGDMWKTELSKEYDVALLFNIIHMFKGDANLALLMRVSAALPPGGMVIIFDQMAMKSSGPTAKATAGLVGLDLFVEVNGQTYPPREVMAWLNQAGFISARSISLRNSPGFALVIGTKSG